MINNVKKENRWFCFLSLTRDSITVVWKTFNGTEDMLLLILALSYLLELLVEKDAFVLCRVFQKSGSGPKNGEKYGAPFVEEEWEDEEFDMVPKVEDAEEVDFGDDVYLDGHDLEQVCAPNFTVSLYGTKHA